MTFYQFAGEHPWVTFFLALIAGDAIIKVVSRICHTIDLRSDK